MNKNIFNFLLRKALFLSAIFFLTLLFSCKKDGELVPDFDNGNLEVFFTDTFSIEANVVQEDSLRTDISNTNLLGYYNDHIFGPSSSSIYTQVLLTGTSVDFGTTPILDSIVLSLDFQGFYGDGFPMDIEVYKLIDSLDPNTDYYSNSNASREPTPIASARFSPNSSSDLLITLDASLGNALLANAPYADNAALDPILKGLYIATKDSVNSIIIGKKRGSIAYFDLNSANSKVTLFYHYNNVPKNSYSYDFSINSEGVKFSHFEHNYSGTDVEAHLNNSPTKDTSVIYVSSMAGVKTKIDIPNIKDLVKDGSVTINKAELIFTVQNGTEGLYESALSTLSLVGIDETGASVFLTDFFEGTDHFGGTVVNNGTYKTYTFNISRHIHKLLYNTPTDYGMYLIASGSTVKANRSVIYSENSSIYKINLEITYSKL